MAHVYVFVIRISDVKYIKYIVSQIASLLSAICERAGTYNTRLVILIELGWSSYRVRFADRPVGHFLQNFDHRLNTLSLFTAHPSRLTRRVDELHALRDELRANDIPWVSLQVDPNRPTKLISPFNVQNFETIEESLKDMEIGTDRASGYTLRRMRTRLRIAGPLAKGADLPQLTAIRGALAQLCRSRGLDRVVMVCRTSPNPDGADSVDSQRSLLSAILPEDMPCQELVGESKSAYSGQWSENVASQVQSWGSRKMLILSASLDRLTRRTEGFEALRQLHNAGHLVVSLLWDMPTRLSSSPWIWLVGNSVRTTEHRVDAAVVAEFNQAVDVQQRAKHSQISRLAVFAPISLFGHGESAIADLVSEHVAMAESAGRQTNGRQVHYSQAVAPEELEILGKASAWPDAGDFLHDYINCNSDWRPEDVEVSVELCRCKCLRTAEGQEEYTHPSDCRCSCKFCQLYSACLCPQADMCDCPTICDCTCVHCHLGQYPPRKPQDLEASPALNVITQEDEQVERVKTMYGEYRYKILKVAYEHMHGPAGEKGLKPCIHCGKDFVTLIRSGRATCPPCLASRVEQRLANPAYHRVCRAKNVDDSLCSGPGYTVAGQGRYCVYRGKGKCIDKLRAYLAGQDRSLGDDLVDEADDDVGFDED